MPDLADNIKKFRILSKLTQEELASKLGKTKNVISNWERGDNKPDTDTIEAMCKIFNITPNEIYGWNNKDGNAMDFSSMNTILARNGKKLTAEEKNELIKILLSDD